ncbi:MAG: hypothetical protein FWG89_09430 [Treponema sp.]|nr:hypothetical protein [Treponema sp.]
MFLLRKAPFAGAALTGLVFAVLLFIGCTMDGGNGDGIIVGLDSRLIGTWESEFDETYVITGTHLTYTDYMGDIWGGSIVYAANFNHNTGVIIILYDTDKKQEWPIYDTDWNIIGTRDTTGKDFYGIYFRNLTQNSVVLSNSSDQTDYSPSETATGIEAINRFTLDNMPGWINISSATPFKAP